MLTKTLYHGTKIRNIQSVLNKPMMKHNLNGFGLYLTTSKELASTYGEVIAFEVPMSFEVDVMRVMEGYVDTRHEGELEYIINTQATYVEFMRTMEDAYVVPNVIPF